MTRVLELEDIFSPEEIDWLIDRLTSLDPEEEIRQDLLAVLSRASSQLAKVGVTPDYVAMRLLDGRNALCANLAVYN